ncbi:MAG: methyl-accepting chemotaxis protein, partial [Spirochaetales bacterium]|nr:methyl-accepting chemotaxis protein [Spirochaetales bacterium]
NKDGEGFVDYLWPKPTKEGFTEDQPKLSYVRLIKEWDWIIGTGIYIDDAVLDAQENSKNVIKSMRYDQGTGYFWINDTALPYPRMIMHPTVPSLDGEVMDDPKYNVAYGTDKSLFTAFVEVCNKDGEGFVDYLWPKPTKEGLTEDQPKLSFVKLFPEWNWIIGTGIYIDEIDLAVQQKADAISKKTGRVVIIIVIISLVIFAIAFAVSYIFANTLSRPLIKITDSAGKIAEGDLDVEMIQKVARDEVGILNKAFVEMIGSLKYKERTVSLMADGDFSSDVQIASEQDTLGKSIVKMTDSLNNLLTQINMSVDQVNIGADQVSQASQSLSQGATEQASSLEEISASVTQINSQSRQNAENATEANSLAKQSADDAEKGNKQMAALSEAMDKINVSSDQIKKIVKVIDDIAFQT